MDVMCSDIKPIVMGNQQGRYTRSNCNVTKNSGTVRSTYVHGVSTCRLFACVAFRKSPEERVGKSIFSHVNKDGIIDFEGGEVG